MTTTDIKEWIKAVRSTLANLASQDFGYPLGVNEVRERSAVPHAGLPLKLEALYGAFDGVSLPNVHVGYFIDPASRVVSAAERGEPTLVEGDRPITIHVFGSDGGGGRFALGMNDGAVYYLPSSGAVEDGKFLESPTARVCQVATSVSGFLERLRMDIEAFVRDDIEHEYMAR